MKKLFLSLFFSYICSVKEMKLNIENNSEKTIYAKETIELVTVAKVFCDCIDQVESLNRDKFLDVMLKLLPMLYSKGINLQNDGGINEDLIEEFANEVVYGHIESTIANLLGNEDSYLEVFNSDIDLSDTPIVAFVSTSIADIWQDMYNFVYAFKTENEETMSIALAKCRENFSEYWGRSIVNVMRALHNIKYVVNNYQ